MMTRRHAVALLWDALLLAALCAGCAHHRVEQLELAGEEHQASEEQKTAASEEQKTAASEEAKSSTRDEGPVDEETVTVEKIAATPSSPARERTTTFRRHRAPVHLATGDDRKASLLDDHKAASAEHDQAAATAKVKAATVVDDSSKPVGLLGMLLGSGVYAALGLCLLCGGTLAYLKRAPIVAFARRLLCRS